MGQRGVIVVVLAVMRLVALNADIMTETSLSNRLYILRLTFVLVL